MAKPMTYEEREEIRLRAANASTRAEYQRIVGRDVHDLLDENQRLTDELDAAQSSGDRSWGREHELLAELDEARRIARKLLCLNFPPHYRTDAPTMERLSQHLGADKLPGWLAAADNG